MQHDITKITKASQNQSAEGSIGNRLPKLLQSILMGLCEGSLKLGVSSGDEPLPIAGLGHGNDVLFWEDP